MTTLSTMMEARARYSDGHCHRYGEQKGWHREDLFGEFARIIDAT
jgi:hypothetical protein